MSDFITLACPACGGNLAVTKDAERFACPFCNREHLVRSPDDLPQLVPIATQLGRIGEGIDRYASELTMRRLQKEREELIAAIGIVQKCSTDWGRELERLQGVRSTARFLWPTFLTGTLLAIFFLLWLIQSDVSPPCCSAIVMLVVGVLGLHTTLNVYLSISPTDQSIHEAVNGLAESDRQLREIHLALQKVDADIQLHNEIVHRR